MAGSKHVSRQQCAQSSAALQHVRFRMPHDCGCGAPLFVSARSKVFCLQLQVARCSQRAQLLPLLLLLVHMACNSPAAAAALLASTVADASAMQHAVCYLELLVQSSGNLGTPALILANLTCTSSSGHDVPVSINITHSVQQNRSGKARLGSINVSGVQDLKDSECSEHAASLRRSGSHPLW
jgi:hypothetical protein